MKYYIFTLLGIAIFHNVLAFPQHENGNLKYTFGENEELPAGFFDFPEEMKKRSPPAPPQQRDDTEPNAGERKQYPGCRDGSGGMCIEAGQCPADLKAEKIRGKVACDAGQECCYGGPLNSRTPCADKGGECTAPPRSCGNGPKIESGTECNHHGRGEICCIWVF